MIEEYERISQEADINTSGGQATQAYFLKRAADFRAQKNRMEEQFQVLAARSRAGNSELRAHAGFLCH
jgi:hypothetical protein